MSVGGECEAQRIRVYLVQLHNLAGIVLEELKEGCLRTSGALGASELKPLADGLDVLEVHHELLDPLGGALACAQISTGGSGKRMKRGRDPYRQ